MTFSASPSSATLQAYTLFADVDSGIIENVIIRNAFIAMAANSLSVDRITHIGLAISGYDDNASTRGALDIERHLANLVKAGVLRSMKVRGVRHYELNLKF